MTLPDSSFLPAPLWLITALHVLTLSLHFAAMNFVLGGTLLVLTGKFQRRWENPTVRRFLALFPSAMAATVTLGVAPLLFLQLVYPRQMYSAAIVSGWFWFLVIPVVIATYYLFHAASRTENAGPSSKTPLLWLALCGLLYVSVLYSSVFSMAEHPGLIQQLYSQNQAGLQWNPEVGDYLLRWLHMVLGAVTVGAYFMGLLGKDDPETFPLAKRLFGIGMALAAVAGFAYLGSLREIVAALMRTPAIWALLVAILLSLGSLHFFFTRNFLYSGVALFVSLVLMVYTRQELRVLNLQGQFSPASWRIATQGLPLVLFLICFIVAGGVAVYMLRLFFKSPPESA